MINNPSLVQSIIEFQTQEMINDLERKAAANRDTVIVIDEEEKVRAGTTKNRSRTPSKRKKSDMIDGALANGSPKRN